MQRILLRCLGQLAIASLLLPNASAQQVCIPVAYGVPDLTGSGPMYGAPRWWGVTDPIHTVLTRLDDPRWNGAVSQDINGEVTFRALHRSAPDTLFLSWTTKIDNRADPANLGASTGDQLVVGFKQQSGPAVFIQLGLMPSPQTATTNLYSNVVTWTGTGSPTGVPTPSWMSAASGTLRVWTSDNGAGKVAWTFQVAVPIRSTGSLDDGINLANQFQLFYAFLVTFSGSGGDYVVEYDWGTPQDAMGNPSSIRDATGAVGPPDPTKVWGKLAWGTSSNCVGDVRLDINQIGVGDPPDFHINYTTLNNDITAKPENISNMSPNPSPKTIDLGRIQADFFVSNYGSQVGTSDFWKKISPTSPTPPTNIAAIAPGGFGVIHFPWPTATAPLTAAEQCLYDDRDPLVSGCPTRGISDQCILVQLSEVTPPPPPPPPAPPPPTPPPLVFRNQSIYRNMLFKSASTLRHRAQISVVGLKPLPDNRSTRDVYLYVETVNMPEKVSGAAPGPAVTATRDTLFVARRDTSLRFDWGVIRLARGDSLRIPLTLTLLAAGASAGERFAAVRRAAQSGKLTAAEVDSQVPTFRIHAYHTTGHTLGGVPILEPQTSFGYWVEHDGETSGWSYKLEGETIVEVGPHFYKIEVPNNGRAIITTTIEALPWRPFAWSLHGGLSFPTGNLKTTNDRGLGVTGDLEYWLSRRLAVQGLFGYHRFGGRAPNPDLEITHASAGLELRVTTGSPSILLDGGGGTYRFKPASTKPGTHAGVSVEFDVSPRVSLGLNGRLHTVFTTGSNTTFYSVQAGGWIKL